MKVLCIIPPYIPSYFNAGHHLPIFQVACFLRKYLPDITVEVYDCAALNITWKEVCNILVSHFDVIVVMNDFDGIDTFPRFMKYTSVFCPDAYTITFGRLSKLIPKFFFQFGFNAVHCDGDPEQGILAFVQYMMGQNVQLSGIRLKENPDNYPHGIYLLPEKWVLPNVKEIPYSAYSYMYRNDLNKFCGIPERQELVVPVARGCPTGCMYCDVAQMQGTKERRLSVERTVEYITNSFETLPFEYVTFYAPTFTLDKKWVFNLCNQLILHKKTIPWKCVTLLHMLDEKLIETMAKSGCIRISFGIETFSGKAEKELPNCKKGSLAKFTTIAKNCQEYGIELNCFVMLGLPHDSPEYTAFTMQTCINLGARVRPTIYTPYHLLRDDMSLLEVSNFNRQFFVEDIATNSVIENYYKLLHQYQGDAPTKIFEKIKKCDPKNYSKT